MKEQEADQQPEVTIKLTEEQREQAKRATGKLVVAYTHACFFIAFRAMGLRDPIRGHGRLLASLAQSP